jgi:hypothetical protein
MQLIIPEIDFYSAAIGAVVYLAVIVFFARPVTSRRAKAPPKKVVKQEAQRPDPKPREDEDLAEASERTSTSIAEAYAAEYRLDMYDAECPSFTDAATSHEGADDDDHLEDKSDQGAFPHVHLLVLLPLLAIIHTLRSSHIVEPSTYSPGALFAEMIPDQMLTDIIEGREDSIVTPPMPDAANIATPARLTQEAPERVVPDVDVSDIVSGFGQLMSANSSLLYTVQLTRQPVPVNSNGATVYHKSAYFGELLIGEPATKFTVVFDTGSGHLVLPSTYCRSETCKAHTRYSRRASLHGRDIDFDGSTVLPGHPRDQITISFGTGEVSGVFVEDHVCLQLKGDASNQQLQGQSETMPRDQDLGEGCLKMRIIAATEMSEQPFKSFHFDGVLGLGLDGLSQTPEFNFLRVISAELQRKGGAAAQTFAVFLADSDKEMSEISFGGWKTEHLDGELGWNSVPDPKLGHWLVHIKALRIGDEVLRFCEDGSCQAAVDTGTSLLAVPTAIFPELYELLRHPAHRSGDCAFPGYGPDFHIELDNFTVSLSPKDYARQERKKVDPETPWEVHLENKTFDPYARTRKDLFCKPALMTMDLPAPLGPKLFILGEPILRKFYSVYDANQKRIGFGRAIHVKEEEIIEDDAEDAPISGMQGDSERNKRASGSMAPAFKAARRIKLR